MTTPTPDELADDIEAAVSTSGEVAGAIDVAIDKAVASMRAAADALAAGANALHTARNSHNAQARLIRDDLLDTANMVRDLDVVQPPAWTPRFPGDTPPGTIRLGVTYGSNSPPGDRYGSTIGCRRTFSSSWANRNSLIAYAKADHANGVLPFISTKIDVKALAAGSTTVRADLHRFIDDLKALGKPVVLGVYHEPEDDIKNSAFSSADFRASQREVRESIDTSGATNIAFATPLMSYTFKPASGRNPLDYYPGDGVWDCLAVDAYSKDVSWAEVTGMEEWRELTAFAKARNLPVIVGEWGQRGNDTTSVAKMRKAYDAFIAQHVPIVAWFDTSLNGGYPLVPGPMFDAFRQLVADSRSVTLLEQPGETRGPNHKHGPSTRSNEEVSPTPTTCGLRATTGSARSTPNSW